MTEVRDFEYDTKFDNKMRIVTYIQTHRTYDLALASHNRYLGKIAVLKTMLSSERSSAQV